jgi:hypothetical protein
MRFECDFCDREDQRHRVTVKIELTPDEVRTIKMLCREHAPDIELTTHAFVLKHAYAQAPEGYGHIVGGIRQVMIN